MIISSVDEGSLPLSRVDKDGQMTGTYILMCLNTSSYTQFVVLCWSELSKIIFVHYFTILFFESSTIRISNP